MNNRALIASLEYEGFLNLGQLLKERICSQGTSSFLSQSTLTAKGGKHENIIFASTENVPIHRLKNEREEMGQSLCVLYGLICNDFQADGTTVHAAQ